MVDRSYRFTYNKVSRDGLRWRMACLEKRNPGNTCRALATLLRHPGGSFTLTSQAGVHSHPGNPAGVLAEQWRGRMAEEVVREGWVPVSEVIRRVRREMEESLGGQEELLKAITRELGSTHSLEQKMFRVKDL